MKKMRIVTPKIRNKYNVSIEYKDDMTGKRRVKKIDEANTKEEALALAKEYEERLDAGENLLNSIEKENIRFGYCVEKGIESAYGRKNKKAGNTYLSYMNTYRNHIEKELGGYYASKMTTSVIQEFIDSKAKKYSKSTVNTIKTVIAKGCEYAQQKDWINFDIMNGVKISGKENDINDLEKRLTVDEINNLISSIPDNSLRLKVLISSSLGLRLSEVLGLSWKNIDLIENKLYVRQIVAKDEDGRTIIQGHTKNKRDLSLIIPDKLKKELVKYKVEWNKRALINNDLRKEELLFTGKNGEVEKTSATSKKFKRITEKLGYKNITFHSLRHSFATILFENEVDKQTIAKLLNQKSVNVTEGYTHLTDRVVERSANIINSVL